MKLPGAFHTCDDHPAHDSDPEPEVEDAHATPLKILSGNIPEYVVTHRGQSQYSKAGGGVSACGLAALNCARLVLGCHAAGLGTTELDVLKPCLSWENSGHLAVEDICKAPLFNKSMAQLSSSYGPSNCAFFTRILQGLADVTKERGASACTIITRPPEILACFSIADVPAGTQLFIIFDSHPRPDKHPHGAAFIFFNSVRETARYLSSLLHFDEDILEEEGVQWQAQLLSQCSGDVFVASDTPVNGMQWADAALEASLQALSAQARVRELEEQKHELEGEKKRLREEIVGLEHDLLRIDDLFQRERQERKREKAEFNRKQFDTERTRGSYWGSYVSPWWTTKPAADGPLGSVSSASDQARHDADTKRDNRTHGNGATTNENNSWRVTGRRRHGSSRRGRMEQREGEAKPRDTVASPGGDKVPPPPPPPPPPAPAPDVDPVAVELQIFYDEENRALEEQFRQLEAEQPQFFDCGVCFEKFQEDHIARVHPCEHAFCRGCLAGWARSKIEEHRYPVLCPICVADRNRAGPSGEVDDEAIQQLGLTEQQYEIFVEMQMNKFSTILDCRGCNETFFVDREEYQNSEIIHCPLKGCGYVWCKLCSQKVDPAGPKHSCDGTNELEHIMKEKGWKHCPGCQTPAEKISGCNHLSCLTPGCNSHFCYQCGVLIVRSALPSEIAATKAQHFKHCKAY
ncbi:hypothetical protein BC628DRAFT_1419870 [Trametes gibbosa]|uniref:RBR-type E3 ubiquitin transferase n=1 Tax=Trametes gibbosa TaxID=160864 RepID=A0A6G6FQG7_9APHY|nr:hypothetical protein BC628DRAFT_1419870 [Trametes gibbosa]QIE48556.1 hypothetical protein [Trametes gibbosa]